MRRLVKRAFRRLGYDVVRAKDPDDLGSLLRRFLPNADLIFDVGANLGQSVQLYRSIYPSAHIHSFEPDTATFTTLQTNLADERNLTLQQLALGDMTGTAVFSRYSQSDMSSFLPPSSQLWAHVQAKIDVPISTIDAYCAENGIDHIDLLKTDTQGYDLVVLKGAAGMLPKVELIKVELNFADLYEGQGDPLTTIAWLRDHGFQVGAFCEAHQFKGALGWLDAIFVRSSATRDRDR